MRIDHFRPVHVKSKEAQLVRTLVQARRQVVASPLRIQGSIRGLLKVHGLKIGEVHRCLFAKRVGELLKEVPGLEVAIGPLMRCAEQLLVECKLMDKQLAQRMKCAYG